MFSLLTLPSDNLICPMASLLSPNWLLPGIHFQWRSLFWAPGPHIQLSLWWLYWGVSWHLTQSTCPDSTHPTPTVPDQHLPHAVTQAPNLESSLAPHSKFTINHKSLQILLCRCFQIDHKPNRDSIHWVIFWPSNLGNEVLKLSMLIKYFEFNWILDLLQIYVLGQAWEVRTLFLGFILHLSMPAIPYPGPCPHYLSPGKLWESPNWCPCLSFS